MPKKIYSRIYARNGHTNCYNCFLGSLILRNRMNCQMCHSSRCRQILRAQLHHRTMELRLVVRNHKHRMVSENSFLSLLCQSILNHFPRPLREKVRHFFFVEKQQFNLTLSNRTVHMMELCIQQKGGTFLKFEKSQHLSINQSDSFLCLKHH